MPTQYFYSIRDWDVNEVKIMIDAVSSAQFISPKKTKALISKLSVMAGKQHRDSLTPQVCVSESIKAESDQLLLIIQAVDQAIRMKKKISFCLFNYNTAKKPVRRHNGEEYVISPYNTVWKDDRYYVVGWSDKREKIVSMRVDRMTVPVILEGDESDAVPPPDDYSVRDYTDTVTKMYGDTKAEVVLRCKTHMVDNIIDKFGTGVELTNIRDDTFDAVVTVAVSGTFLSWVFQYAGEIIILSPGPVRKLYANMLRTAAVEMKNDTFTDNGERVWKL